MGHEDCNLVIGGGNIVRGVSAAGLTEYKENKLLIYMGMLAYSDNGIAIQEGSGA